MFRVFVGTCVVLLCAAMADAAPIVIDFSTLGLAEGQSVEGTTISGATLTSELGNLEYTNGYGAGIYDPLAGVGDVYVAFAGGVSSVSVRGGDGAGDTDAFAISAYALGTFNTPVFGGANEPEWYTLTVSGLGAIGRIVIDPGNAGTLPGNSAGVGGVVVTDLNFDTAAVPEPATLALFGFGLAAAVRRRSRRS
jgi:hypothetical protein